MGHGFRSKIETRGKPNIRGMIQTVRMACTFKRGLSGSGAYLIVFLILLATLSASFSGEFATGASFPRWVADDILGPNSSGSSYQGTVLTKGGYLAYELSLGRGQFVVYQALVNSSATVMLLTPAEYSLFQQGEGFLANYSATINASEINLVKAQAGQFFIVLTSNGSPVYAYLGYVVASGSWRPFALSSSNNLSIMVPNLSKVSIELIATQPVNASIIYPASHFPSPLGELSYSVTRTMTLTGGKYTLRLASAAVGTAFVFAALSPTLVNPGNYVQSSMPTGVTSYGVFDVNGELEGYTVYTTAVLGYANISSISAFNPMPPANISESGASLQLNAMMSVNSPTGEQTYWLQNVLDIVTGNHTLAYADNIWNVSAPYANLTPYLVSGEGNTGPATHQNYYGFESNFANYTLPLSILLVTSVISSGQGPVVMFGYRPYSNGSANSRPVYFDNVSLRVPGSAPRIEITPYNTTPDMPGFSGSIYDLELVFGGEGNGETTTFSSLNASLGLYYLSAITSAKWEIAAVPSVYTYGVNTGETATNLAVSLLNGFAAVTTGVKDYGLLSNFFSPPAPNGYELVKGIELNSSTTTSSTSGASGSSTSATPAPTSITQSTMAEPDTTTAINTYSNTSTSLIALSSIPSRLIVGAGVVALILIIALAAVSGTRKQSQFGRAGA